MALDYISQCAICATRCCAAARAAVPGACPVAGAGRPRVTAAGLELQAAVSLARLWRAQGRRDKACERVAGVNGWFSQGFDTADLVAATVLPYQLERFSRSRPTAPHSDAWPAGRVRYANRPAPPSFVAQPRPVSTAKRCDEPPRHQAGTAPTGDLEPTGSADRCLFLCQHSISGFSVGAGARSVEWVRGPSTWRWGAITSRDRSAL